MSEVQRCLSVFAVAAYANNVRSISMADAAVNKYLEPHLRVGTTRAALETLLKAFGAMSEDSVVGYAIRMDLQGRLARLGGAMSRPTAGLICGRRRGLKTGLCPIPP